jgi:hypothetical protein
LPHFNVDVFVDDNGAFPAKFKTDGGQVLRGCSGYNAADLAITSVPEREG